MKKFLASVSSSVALLAMPAIALAQASTVNTTAGSNNITDLLVGLNNLINLIVPFVVGLAVLVVIFGIFSFVVAGADEEKRKGARAYIVWGIIGIFLMLSIWGLVAILANTFGASDATKQDVLQGYNQFS